MSQCELSNERASSIYSHLGDKPRSMFDDAGVKRHASLPHSSMKPPLYGWHALWPIWSWPISSVADIVVSRIVRRDSLFPAVYFRVVTFSAGDLHVFTPGLTEMQDDYAD